MTLPRKIRTLEDVLQLFTHLSVDDDLRWEPDSDLEEFGHYEGEQTITQRHHDLLHKYGVWIPAYSKRDGIRRQRLLEQSLEVLADLGLDPDCVYGMNLRRIDHYLADWFVPEELDPADGCEWEAEAMGMRKKSWSPRKGER